MQPSFVPVAALALLVAAPFAGAQVSVSDAWVRGTVPAQKSTGAFMTLSAPTETTLVSATSPAAKVVEIHEMKVDGGVMTMNAVPRLTVPAGKPVELKPGGYHVMLMGLVQPLKDGETVPLTLTFESPAGKRSTVDVKAVVRPLASGTPPPTR